MDGNGIAIARTDDDIAQSFERKHGRRISGNIGRRQWFVGRSMETCRQRKNTSPKKQATGGFHGAMAKKIALRMQSGIQAADMIDESCCKLGVQTQPRRCVYLIVARKETSSVTVRVVNEIRARTFPPADLLMWEKTGVMIGREQSVYA